MATTTATILSNRMVKWLRSGAASAAVVAAAGCSSHKSQPAPPVATTNPVASHSPLDDAEAFEAPAAPPQVNIFGELDGVARGPVKPIGDEGFQQHTFA